jgi:hypothetical protein
MEGRIKILQMQINKSNSLKHLSSNSKRKITTISNSRNLTLKKINCSKGLTRLVAVKKNKASGTSIDPDPSSIGAYQSDDDEELSDESDLDHYEL